MIDLTVTLTSPSDLQSATSRKNDFDALFPSRTRFADLGSSRRLETHRCMAVLTEDACCADCGKEFEI